MQVPGQEGRNPSGPASHTKPSRQLLESEVSGVFHAISAALARLARPITARQAAPFEYAVWHGWEARRVCRGTWEFRDPRFDARQLAVVTADEYQALFQDGRYS